MRRLGAATASHVASPIGGNVPPSLRAGAAPPLSFRAPAPSQLHDFAFADTVFAKELDEIERPPPSGPIYVDDGMGNTQCVTPLAFRLPGAGKNVGPATRSRVMFAHVRHAIRRALDEMREIWAGTADMVEGGAAGSRFARVLAMWSCFQWSRADLVRAAMIGLAVFAAVGAIGAVTLDADDAAAFAAGPSASSAGVRPGRTIDQHTGKKSVIRGKR